MPPLPSGDEIRPMGKVQGLVQSTAAKKGSISVPPSLFRSCNPASLFLLLYFSHVLSPTNFLLLFIHFMTQLIPVFVAVSTAWHPIDPP